MRKLILAAAAIAIVCGPMATIARADDATVIKRDNPDGDSKTIVKKRDDVNLLPIPHTEEHTTVIKKEGE